MAKTSKNIKKQRLKINNINDLKNALKNEGYSEFNLDNENFKDKVSEVFKIDNSVVEDMYESLTNKNITYKVDDIRDFIEYIKNIKLFKDEHLELIQEIKKINKLNISRVEYERIITTQDEVWHMLEDIENVRMTMSKKISKKDFHRIETLEMQIDKDYIYTKDIELLKKILTKGRNNISETYNKDTKVKVVSIDIPEDINDEYIPAEIGSVEYHNHIKNNIPRMKRLRKNIHKYITFSDKERKDCNINQTTILQDTINIAVAVYDNKEFKAVSGSNDIEGFYKAPKETDVFFKSSKVNKLGQLGVGYDRINDSEKKIFEEIHKQIQLGKVKDYGNLILYSKWEPCPSCYHVVSQFCRKYQNINVEIRYNKEYGSMS